MKNTFKIMNLLIPNNQILDYFSATATKEMICSLKPTFFTVAL